MGTNGAGTCVLTGRPVTVFGDEHFISSLKGFCCTAAPIHAPGGELLGAVDLSTSVTDGRPQNLLLAGHIAFAIEREHALHGGVRGRPS